MGPPLGVLSLHRGRRFPRSAQEPAPCSRRLHAGHHSSRQQASLELVPSQRLELGFGGRPYAFDTSSTVHSRSSSQRAPDGLVPPFPSRSPPRSLDRSSIRWFEPWSCNPSPRGQPSSLVQQSCFHSTWRSPFRAVVAHGRPRSVQRPAERLGALSRLSDTRSNTVSASAARYSSGMSLMPCSVALASIGMKCVSETAAE
jgi:hypothetical protein